MWFKQLPFKGLTVSWDSGEGKPAVALPLEVTWISTTGGNRERIPAYLLIPQIFTAHLP